MPSAYTIGLTGDPNLSYKVGASAGKMLSVLGFNMNLAPVLDITDELLKSFISVRSFSHDPHQVAVMGTEFARGLQDQGIIPISKHFPGHGKLKTDSHHKFPEDVRTKSQITQHDLIPFKKFFALAGDQGTMVAHISYPNLDDSSVPATYSEDIISGILNKQLSYKGIVMTDDIEMSGAGSHENISKRAIAAIKAGNDLVMVGWSRKWQYRSVNAVVNAVKNGEIPVERINKSVRKILGIKSRIHKPKVSNRSLANIPSVKKKFSNIGYKKTFEEIVEGVLNRSDINTDFSNFKKVSVISRNKSFRVYFKKYFQKLPANFYYSTQYIKKNDKEKKANLFVFNVSSTKSYQELMALPKTLKARTLVINSHSKLKVLRPSEFLSVIPTHYRSYVLGKQAALLLSQKINESQLRNQ